MSYLQSLCFRNRSPFFEAALSRWSYSSQKGMEMEIKECRRDILDMVLDYMYGINIQPVEKDLEDLLDIAERFQMLDLKAEIGKVTAATITVDNYKELALRADKFNCKVLAEACIKFMVSNDIMLEWEEARQVPSMAVAFLNMVVDQQRESERVRVQCIKPGCEHTAQYCCLHYN